MEMKKAAEKNANLIIGSHVFVYLIPSYLYL